MQLSLTLRLVPIFAIALLFGCDTAPASAPGNGLDTEDLGPVAAIIRNPVDTRGEEIDTANVALLNFNETEFKFGKVKVGTVINHDFPFTNTGSVPLLITKARDQRLFRH
jgi:hypothetical protein